MACNLKFHTWVAWINSECLKFQQYKITKKLEWTVLWSVKILSLP